MGCNRVARKTLLECTFLIPLRRDKNLSDGKRHGETAWQWLEDRLYPFRGGTCDKLPVSGWYIDRDTQSVVWDDSWRYTVAVPRAWVRRLRAVLRAACVVFAQKCIYLSVAGHAEFVGRQKDEKR